MRKSKLQTLDFYQVLSICVNKLIKFVKIVWFILHSIDWLPKCDDWDDFFDFSRLSFVFQTDQVFPSTVHRIRFNLMHKFGGNYCWSLLNSMIFAGIFFDTQLIVTTTTLVAIWFSCSVLTIDVRFYLDVAYHLADSYKPMPSYKLQLDERVRNSRILLCCNHLSSIEIIRSDSILH